MSDLRVGIVVGLADRTRSGVGSVTKGIRSVTQSIRKTKRGIDELGRANGIHKLGRSVTSLRSATRSLAREMRLPQIAAGAVRVAKGLSGVASAAKRSALYLGAAGAGAAWLFKRGFLDIAAKFEQFRTTLETVEKGSEAASRSMTWIDKFAKKTPYELDEVTEAFVILRSRGINPTDGTLRTLGDTASAMGRPIMAAVEAIADATTGEFERLKAFGITARTKGSRVALEYTDAASKQQVRMVNKSNRAQIQSTLLAIWNESYAGAMAKQSKTWKGMVSNISGHWTGFANLVMSEGLFEWMKDRLGGILATLDTMSKNGELRRWARITGTEIKGVLTTLWDAGGELLKLGRGVVNFIKPIANAVGPARLALGTIAAITFAPVVASLASLVPAIVAVGTALAASPIGAVVLGLAALGAYVASEQAKEAKKSPVREAVYRRKKRIAADRSSGIHYGSSDAYGGKDAWSADTLATEAGLAGKRRAAAERSVQVAGAVGVPAKRLAELEAELKQAKAAEADAKLLLEHQRRNASAGKPAAGPVPIAEFNGIKEDDAKTSEDDPKTSAMVRGFFAQNAKPAAFQPLPAGVLGEQGRAQVAIVIEAADGLRARTREVGTSGPLDLDVDTGVAMVMP